MVNFGKKLVADQLEDWKEYYINYKLMKKRLKQYVKLTQEGGEELRRVLKEFSRMLDEQIEKIVLFLLEQQGLLARRLQELGELRNILLEEPEFSRIYELQEAYRAVGYDLIKLLKFVDMNATGLRKILKKIDKHFGYRFTDYYVSSRANHPCSQLQQVFKHVGISAVAGALSRNLTDLHVWQGSYLSIYDQPSNFLKDPIIDQINAAVDKLTHSTNFLQFLGQHSLIIQDEATTTAEDNVDEQKYHFMSLLLNLANTFLYMVNTYIIVPTADDYALSLGAAATVCGVIIGSMAVAQVFSSVYFSAWSNKSYFRPLIFSSIMLLLGNILYALAYDLKSLAILLIGRLLCGLGSARAVNRRYISHCVPLKTRMKASAAFVSASALGMASGPALAGLLQTNFRIYVFTFNQNTLPGWLMALTWLVYLFWLWISFREPVHDTQENSTPPDAQAGHQRAEDFENNVVQPLLLNSQEKLDEDEDQEHDGGEEASNNSQRPTTSIASAYRLLTPSVKVQLLIYFMLKYAIEILLSESSVITTLYFSWSTSSVAIFLAILGLTVLPVNAVIGSYVTNMFEDRQILLASEIILLLGIILSFHMIRSYTVAQYVISALITFVSAEVLEGVNLSLLSRVMSSRLARGTYNGGLLSTEAGTLARVVADVTITLAGYLVSLKEEYFYWLLGKACIEEIYFNLVFQGLSMANIMGISVGIGYTKEQAFLLETLSHCLSAWPAYLDSISNNFTFNIVQILEEAASVICVTSLNKSDVPIGSLATAVLEYSLLILRDICSWKHHRPPSAEDPADSLVSADIIELLLGFLRELEPVNYIKDQGIQASTDSFHCPYQGFRKDVVSVICCYLNGRKHVQDEIRKQNGIPLLLQQCILGDGSPFLRKWATLSIQYLLEGNLENQYKVAELELKEPVITPQIAQMGLILEIDVETQRPKMINILAQ